MLLKERAAHTARMLRAVCAAFLCAVAVAFTGAASCNDAGRPSRVAAIAFHTAPTDPVYGAVDVAPLDPLALRKLKVDRLLAVYAGDAGGVPMLGRYTVMFDTLRFTPRFAPVPGTRYFARVNGAYYAAKTVLGMPRAATTATWTAPVVSGPPTTFVDAVYPTSETVPMNLLRMYIQFSAPMRLGESAEHVRLLDDHDQIVTNAFLAPASDQELWDREHRRLTLLFDPGRIKRDLTPHDELGLPLHEGRAYRLVIDSAWRDAQGRSMTRPFEKRFRVGPLDRTVPRTATWRVTAPAAGTRDPLQIGFPAPLDHALLGRMLTVKDATGISILGQTLVGERETSWRFAPAAAWAAAPYYVEVDTELEDLAGNNLRRLFDVMPGDSAARGVGAATVRVPFTPRPAVR